jgi:hypothetical protein
MVTKNSSILKLVTEDATPLLKKLDNAEDTVDQTKVILVLKLMLDAQEHHGDHTTSELDQNTESPEKVGLKEEPEDTGDHSPLTTSGITTTVPRLSAET